MLNELLAYSIAGAVIENRLLKEPTIRPSIVTMRWTKDRLVLRNTAVVKSGFAYERWQSKAES